MCSELCDPQPMTCYLWPVTHARPAPQITSWFAECICLLLSDSAGQNVSVWMRPRQRWIINLVNNAWGEVRVGKVQIKSTLNAHLTYRRRTAKSINVWKTPRFVGRIPSPPNGSSSNKLCCAFMCVCVCVCVYRSQNVRICTENLNQVDADLCVLSSLSVWNVGSSTTLVNTGRMTEVSFMLCKSTLQRVMEKKKKKHELPMLCEQRLNVTNAK